MDIVTLGAALNGSAEYVNSHFKGGSNIQIVDNPDGTQTINASGEVSSEDAVARAEIAAIKDGETLDSFGDVETALIGKADTTDIPTVPITAIQKNGIGITPVSGTVNITVPTTAADVSALPDTTKYAAALSLTINSSTFVMTGQLKDQNGDNLGTAQTIDLPLESVVVGGSYNSQTKKVVLTLQNGNTIEFSVADLVSGLQTELSASNKLNPAYINYDSTHAAVTEAQRDQIETNKNDVSSVQAQANWNSETGVTNLFDFDTWLQGLTASRGTVSVTGNSVTIQATSNDAYTNTNTLDIPVKPNTKYILTWDSTATNEHNGNVYIFTNSITSYKKAIVDKFEFTTNSGDTSFKVRLGVDVSGDSITYSNIMLRSGTITDDTYQPYAMSNAELTEKEKQNENNISTANAELIDLVDNGAKNKLNITATSTDNFTVNADKSITVNGTFSAPAEFTIASLTGTVKGVLSGCTNGSTSTYRIWIQYRINNGNIQRIDLLDGSVELDLSNVTWSAVQIRVESGQTLNNVIFKPMLCSKAAWNVSQEYVPYAPTNAELYEMIKALQS